MPFVTLHKLLFSLFLVRRVYKPFGELEILNPIDVPPKFCYLVSVT